MVEPEVGLTIPWASDLHMGLEAVVVVSGAACTMEAQGTSMVASSETVETMMEEAFRLSIF